MVLSGQKQLYLRSGLMTILSKTEVVTSEVMLHAIFTKNGLIVSASVDDVEVEHEATYEDIALDMVADQDVYDDETLEKIIQGLDHMSNYIRKVIDGK